MRRRAVPLLLCALSCARAPGAPAPQPEHAPPLAFASVAAPPAAPVPHGFELALLDDAGRLAALEHSAETPAGVSLVEERLQTREGETLRSLFLRLELQNDETLDQALSRIARWLAALELPANERLVWGPVADADESARSSGYRSYVLFPPCIVAKDVLEASVEDQSDFPGVRLRLSPDAAEHLQALTRDHRKERMAIVVNGLVLTAPVIQTEISGGNVMITTGGATTEQMREGAEALVNLLRSKPK